MGNADLPRTSIPVWPRVGYGLIDHRSAQSLVDCGHDPDRRRSRGHLVFCGDRPRDLPLGLCAQDWRPQAGHPVEKSLFSYATQHHHFSCCRPGGCE